MSKERERLLSYLQQRNSWLSITDIVEGLGRDYAERSVRRWLKGLYEEGLIEREGKTKGIKYRASLKMVDESKQGEASNIIDTHVIFTQSSQNAISFVRQPIFARKPASYNESFLDSYIPNSTVYLSPSQNNLLEKAGARASSAVPAGTYARKVWNRLIIDLSFNSSRLEGNTFSIAETEQLLVQGRSPVGKLDEEKIMIINHREAIRYLVDNASQLAINFNTLCTLHYLLSDGLIPREFSGHIREEAVRIGASTYIPLEGRVRLTSIMLKIAEKAQAIVNPFEQSLFLLTHIAYLQAFYDVNKRTSRLAANIPYIQRNLVPLAFQDINKDDYASSIIAVYELNDVNPLADLFTWSYLRTCEIYDATIEAMGYDEVRVRYRSERRAAINYVVLNQLTGESVEKYLDQVSKKIAVEHRLNFIDDIKEDLQHLNSSTIAGLGISIDQLEDWLKLSAT